MYMYVCIILRLFQNVKKKLASFSEEVGGVELMGEGEDIIGS